MRSLPATKRGSPLDTCSTILWAVNLIWIKRLKVGEGGNRSNKWCQHSLLSAYVCWDGRSLQARAPIAVISTTPWALCWAFPLKLEVRNKCFPEVSSAGNLSPQWEKWWHTFLKCQWTYFVMVLGKYGSSQWYLNVNMWSHKYQHHQLSTKKEALREEQEQWVYLRAAVSSSSPSPVNKLQCAGRPVSTKTSHSVFLSFINSLIGHINAPSWSYAHVGGFSISF